MENKCYFPQNGKRNGNKYLVSHTLGSIMEKLYPFPNEKFENKFIFSSLVPLSDTLIAPSSTLIPKSITLVHPRDTLVHPSDTLVHPSDTLVHPSDIQYTLVTF